MFNPNFKPFVPRKRCVPSKDTEKRPSEDSLPTTTTTTVAVTETETGTGMTVKPAVTEESVHIPPPCEEDNDDEEYEDYDDKGEYEEYEEEYEEPPTSDQVCTFWLKGECLVVNCPFLHTNIGVLCKFYKSGNCIMGDDCIYMHSSLEDQIERLYGDKFDPEYDEVYDFGFYDPECDGDDGGDGSPAQEIPTEDDFPPLGTDPKAYKLQKAKEVVVPAQPEVTDEEKRRLEEFKAYSGYSQDLSPEKGDVLRKWVSKLGEGSEFVAEVAAREGLPDNEHLSLEYVKWVLSEHDMEPFDSIAQEDERKRDVDAVLHGKLAVMHFRQGVKAYLAKNITRSKEHTEKGAFHYAHMVATAVHGEKSALCDSFNSIEETHETILNMAKVSSEEEAEKLFEGVFVTTKSSAIRYVFVVMPDKAFFEALMRFIGHNHFKYANCTPEQTGEIVCVVCPPNRN